MSEHLVTVDLPNAPPRDAAARAFRAHQSGDLVAAETLYTALLCDYPSYAEGHNNLGTLCIQRGRLDEAVVHCQNAIAHAPEYALPHANLGGALIHMRRFEEALPFCKRAIKLAPDLAPAWVNLGDALLKLGRGAEAEPVLRKAVDIAPHVAEAQVNYGLARWTAGDLFEAESLFRRAWTEHQHPIARKNLGVIKLARNDFSGWLDYEARWEADGVRRQYTDHPEWDGLPHPEGTLVVAAEQGLGDEILYATMLESLFERFEGKIIWCADHRLLPVLADVYQRLRSRVTLCPRQIVHTVAMQGATHRIDAGSLGKYLRRSVADFPASSPLRNHWGLYYPLKRIGVSWRSGNALYGHTKSIPLPHWTAFLREAEARGYEIVSLQYDADAELAGYPDIKNPGIDCRRDLTALWQIIMTCEQVITVSNTTAHLAAAAGGPRVTVITPDGLGRYWYWGVGETTPWYADARIVRREGRPWDDVLAGLDIFRKTA